MSSRSARKEPGVKASRHIRQREAVALAVLNKALQVGVIAKYARCTQRGEPKRCTVGKVIFNSREAAEQCAVELSRTLGYPPMRAYECQRSRHGHHHLARDLARPDVDIHRKEEGTA